MLSEGTDLFDPQVLAAVAKNSGSYKARQLLIYMPPGEFLLLAEQGYDPKKDARINELIAAGVKFNAIPRLNIRADGKVVGHEGRHRARALQARGVKYMPVELISQNIRWSEQNDPKSWDYEAVLPARLQSEDRPLTVPAPYLLTGPERGMARPEYRISTSGQRVRMSHRPGQRVMVKRIPNTSTEIGQAIALAEIRGQPVWSRGEITAFYRALVLSGYAKSTSKLSTVFSAREIAWRRARRGLPLPDVSLHGVPLIYRNGTILQPSEAIRQAQALATKARQCAARK